MPSNPRSTLELTPDEMRTLGYRVVDLVVEHLSTLPEQPPGYRPASREAFERLLREPPPEEGRPFEEVLGRLQRDVLPQRVRVDHPRFFAFVPGPSNYVSVLAEFLVAGHNVFAGSWLGSAGAAQLELVVVDWLRAELGMPEGAGGLFTSGGSMANLIALAAARHARGADGRAVVYFSDQTHVAVPRGLRTLGFAEAALRRLPSDADFRLEPAALARAVREDRASGRAPFCVIANAGTTSSGAVDPLGALADLCAAEGLWLHADGAYGAAAALCEQGRTALRGLERVDSLALDPHKWLFQPIETGLVLLRDAGDLRRAFATMPEYMRDADLGEREVNFFEHGVQLTRAFRALKLWLSLQTFGMRAFREAVARGFVLAEHAERRLRAGADWELVSPATLAIVAFRHAPPELAGDDTALDEHNRVLTQRLAEDGFAMLSTTELRGRTVLRMCTINPRTTEDDIDATIARLEALATGGSGGRQGIPR